MDTTKSSAPAHHPEVTSGDGIAYAGSKRQDEECTFCWDSGYVFLGGLDEDGEEVIYAVACRRCNPR